MASEDCNKLRALLDLNLLVDGLVETALQKRESLAEAMLRILPALCAPARLCGTRRDFGDGGRFCPARRSHRIFIRR
jgi:hypothetical protein